MDLHSAEGGQMSVGRKAQGWYLWRLGIISQVQERKNEAGQPAHSFRFAIKEITYFFSTLSFPLFPPPPFYSSFFQLPQSLTLPHHFFYHLLLLPTELQSSPAGRAGTQHPETPTSGREGWALPTQCAAAPKNSPTLPWLLWGLCRGQADIRASGQSCMYSLGHRSTHSAYY